MIQVSKKIKNLAIFGGEPIFKKALHVGRPNVGNVSSFVKRLKAMFRRGWLTNDGPLVREFEKKICKRLKVRNCVAMCNGTTALEIAIRSLELRGEVIVPSMTFVATAHSLWWQKIKPVFCDIEPSTLHLDPRCVEKKITSKTTGIIGVHLWGKPCDIRGLERVAKKHRLKLVFDAAHALGCSYQGRMIGSFGDAEVLSFHATKVLNTFEGGAVVTQNDALAAKMRLMRNFGFAGHDQVIYIGINGKMSEPCAAMGLTNLEKLPEFVKGNRRNYEEYRRLLEGLPGVRFVPYDERETSNYHYIILEIDPAASPLTRDELLRILWAENVLARRYFYPGCHAMEPYRSLNPKAGLSLPVTVRAVQRVLALPNGPLVPVSSVRRIGELIRFVFSHAQPIRDRLTRGSRSIPK